MGGCCSSSNKSDADDDSNKCMDVLFDILTIFISIADVATDIIVLITYYMEGRTAFFAMSLIILIIAQIAYSIIFIIRYKVFDRISEDRFYLLILIFFALLPFGTLISFIIYFTDNPDSWFSNMFYTVTKLDVDNTIASDLRNTKHSKMTQWMIKKLSKHIGFIIEAGIEALPQSLLQITAIVVYKEANYISIASIFLSMFSVMTKSLVFSQGIDIKTYIWTWLSIVIDFYGIFFTLTWVFYTNESLLAANFLGYFTVIGEMWFYKIMIGNVPIVIIGLLWWFVYYLWIILGDIVSSSYTKLCERICGVFCYGFAGSFFIFVTAAVGFIALEIFCFSCFALALFMFCTLRWKNYTKTNVAHTVNGIVTFISKASIFNRTNDRMLRILAINYCMPQHNIAAKRYTNKIEQEQGVNGLQKITYADIRNNAGDKEYVDQANVFPIIWWMIKEVKPKKNNYQNCLKCKGNGYTQNVEYCALIWGYFAFYIIFPVFTLSKIFQIFFPYIICSYLSYYDHWNDVDLFQLIMLWTYIGLQFMLFILGIFVLRIHWILWHIQPGVVTIRLGCTFKPNQVLLPANKWYMAKTAIPIIEKFIFNLYGHDIGAVIMDYYHNIDLKTVQL